MPASILQHHLAHQLEPDGRYRIDSFDQAPAFSSFLSGIAGPQGVPLWCMYVNRGQAVVSFGVANKDHAIAEFLPATWAYQLVGTQGFRTFCKINGQFYEPFQPTRNDSDPAPTRSMWILPDRLTLQEVNEHIGLTTQVTYWTAVNQPVPALFRQVTITNTNPHPIELDLLDGLPVVLSAGIPDLMIKKMRRLSEAYATVRQLTNQAAFYCTRVRAQDDAEVKPTEDGNFYFASTPRDSDTLLPLPIITDPDIVFGQGNDLITPRQFINHPRLQAEHQVHENRLMSAFSSLQATLEPQQSITLYAIAGYATRESIATNFLAKFTKPQDYLDTQAQSHHLHNQLTLPAFTASSNPLFDAYTQQNYLDNILRGGIPVPLETKTDRVLLHLYTRRHGDLERDYNDFHLAPHPLSDGPGNYRDICQNRRLDVWFYPQLLDEEIRMFANLLQADGYNPLSVRGYLLQLPPDTNPDEYCPTADAPAKRAFAKIFDQPFSPGQLLAWANHHQINLPNPTNWVNTIIQQCVPRLTAHGHEGGYWIDHWTYITDLLEAFATVYPDRVQQILTEKTDIAWHDGGVYIRSKADRYVQHSAGPIQIGGVVEQEDQPKPVKLPKTTLLGKLCALLAVKALSFDINGVGLEMQAGRPGWNDAMNGLPGLFGSSTCETAEVARLATWLLDQLPAFPDQTPLPTALAQAINDTSTLLQDPAKYNWQRASAIQDHLQEQRRSAAPDDISMLSEGVFLVPGDDLRTLLKRIDQRAKQGLDAAVDPDTGLVHTYYQGRPQNVSDQVDANGQPRNEQNGDWPYIQIDAFDMQPLPLFLEGQVHYLRTHQDPQTARKNRLAVRQTGLYDQSLKMYLLNENLHRCPLQIGRARTFSRGWLENESIWLHMSYKYLLELVRCGLFQEFYEDAKTMLVPFMDPTVYGRSVLENSSFIASSVSPDPAARGRGFVARLTGSTAEFIHLWLLLTVGPKPFFLKDDQLGFQLTPALPGSWFTQHPRIISFNDKQIELPPNSFACALLGSILLVYHNPQRRDTFGHAPAQPVKIAIDEQPPVQQAQLGPTQANQIRSRQCQRLDVWLA